MSEQDNNLSRFSFALESLNHVYVYVNAFILICSGHPCPAAHPIIKCDFPWSLYFFLSIHPEMDIRISVKSTLNRPQIESCISMVFRRKIKKRHKRQGVESPNYSLILSGESAWNQFFFSIDSNLMLSSCCSSFNRIAIGHLFFLIRWLSEFESMADQILCPFSREISNRNRFKWKLMRNWANWNLFCRKT